MVATVGVAGFFEAMSLKSVAQFVAVVAFALALTVPLVMPPPVHPVNAPTVASTGFTSVFELTGGRPGVYDCVPVKDLHFGTTVLTAPPTGAAAVTPTG